MILGCKNICVNPYQVIASKPRSHFANVFGHGEEEAGSNEGKLNGAGEEVGVDIGQGLVSQDGRVKPVTGGRTAAIIVTPIT